MTPRYLETQMALLCENRHRATPSLFHCTVNIYQSAGLSVEGTTIRFR